MGYFYDRGDGGTWGWGDCETCELRLSEMHYRRSGQSAQKGMRGWGEKKTLPLFL